MTQAHARLVLQCIDDSSSPVFFLCHSQLGVVVVSQQTNAWEQGTLSPQFGCICRQNFSFADLEMAGYIAVQRGLCSGSWQHGGARCLGLAKDFLIGYLLCRLFACAMGHYASKFSCGIHKNPEVSLSCSTRILCPRHRGSNGFPWLVLLVLLPAMARSTRGGRS